MTRTGRIARKGERIVIQKCSHTVDEILNHISTWADYYECYAYASTYAVGETGDEVISDERSVTFEVRYCPELAPLTSTEYRVVFRGDTYDIQSIDPMNYDLKSVKITCRRN